MLRNFKYLLKSQVSYKKNVCTSTQSIHPWRTTLQPVYALNWDLMPRNTTLNKLRPEKFLIYTLHYYVDNICVSDYLLYMLKLPVKSGLLVPMQLKCCIYNVRDQLD